MNEDGFMLEDPDAEARFNFSLSKTLSRGSREKLFAGKLFYLTPSVKPSLQVVTQIITSSGGRYYNIQYSKFKTQQIIRFYYRRGGWLAFFG